MAGAIDRPGVRAWQPREMLMVSEFIRDVFPGRHSVTRVRLGVPHPELVHDGLGEAELAMMRVFNRWADALVYDDGIIHLIEAKIRPRLGPLEALDLYGRLFKNTPEFADVRDWKLEKWFVYAVEDPVMTAMAREQGVRAFEYKPAWLADYLKILRPRERRASFTAGAEFEGGV